MSLAQRDAVLGDRVTVVGNAKGVRSTLRAATGTVLANDQTLMTPATETLRGERLTGLMLSTCNVLSGESGGAAYDLADRVVGMTTPRGPRQPRPLRGGDPAWHPARRRRAAGQVTRSAAATR